MGKGRCQNGCQGVTRQKVVEVWRRYTKAPGGGEASPRGRRAGPTAGACPLRCRGPALTGGGHGRRSVRMATGGQKAGGGLRPHREAGFARTGQWRPCGWPKRAHRSGGSARFCGWVNSPSPPTPARHLQQHQKPRPLARRSKMERYTSRFAHVVLMSKL